MTRWSFGGNRLQIKAEVHILSDVQAQLQSMSNLEASAESALRPLKAKQDLLTLLLANEQDRLLVWLHPLAIEKKHHFTSTTHAKLADVSFYKSHVPTKLIMIAYGDSTFEDGMGREPSSGCTHGTAPPVSPFDARGSMASAQLSTSSSRSARCPRVTAGQPIARRRLLSA
jgi:hypothetical protein